MPRWILVENVARFATMAFDDFALALEEKGYIVGAVVLPACAVGAPHKRDRIWIVANTSRGNDGRYIGESNAGQVQQSGICSEPKLITNATNIGFGRAGDSRQWRSGFADSHFDDPSNAYSFNGNVSGFGTSQVPFEQASGVQNNSTYPNGSGLQNGRYGGESKGYGEANEYANSLAGFTGWLEPWTEVAARVCRVDDGHAAGLDGLGRGSGHLEYSPTGRYRTKRLKAGGNALLAQLAYEIYHIIDTL
jgi:DNA (cytosine-5)-methyltransferase 1